MSFSRYEKSRAVNLLISITFMVASSYLAWHYYQEHPTPKLHWEGIIPLILCLGYFIFHSES